jgi:microcystin-dependent protein
MIRNFVLEIANAPGTALLVQLAGKSQGRQSWTVYTTGSPIFYFIDDGSQAEWGTGVFTSGSPNTISRAAVIGNTAGTVNRLNFTGTVNVYNEIPAERMLYVDNSGIARLPAGTILDPILGGTPVGGQMDYWGPSAPAGWLFCNGLAVSRTTYARLFAVLGTSIGAGDGSTTFTLPDTRGRVVAGRDAMGTGNVARLSGVLGASSDVVGGAGGDQYLHAHTHGLNWTDPGHAHLVFDPTHTHGIADAGHAHGVVVNDAFVGGAGFAAGANYAVTGAGYNTDVRGTGVSLYGAATGIGIYGNFTGIAASVQSNGNGGSQNVQPTIMANKIIFAGA